MVYKCAKVKPNSRLALYINMSISTPYLLRKDALLKPPYANSKTRVKEA